MPGWCRSLLAATLFAAPCAHAWGPDGHRVVGALALQELTPQARTLLYGLAGTPDHREIVDWCNWPDEYRSTDEGAWTAPLHYVNLPPGESEYDPDRDCPDQLCVTEAIGRYVAELVDVELPNQQRLEAFGFVCHFVGDLAQPLHAGLASDRGGTDFDILYNGQQQNLHRFWDSTLIVARSYRWQTLAKTIRLDHPVVKARYWQADMPADWTTRSHALAVTLAYPEDMVISLEFANRSWQIIRQQLAHGAHNLSRVLNTALVAGD